MLAPLEDRSVLTVRGCDEACAVREELHELRLALCASRLRLRRSALQGARQVMALNAEIVRLQQCCERRAQQLERYATGGVIVDLGRRLMALSEANARLIDDSRRATVLEKVLGLSEAEQQRLARERDRMARELARHRHDALLGINGYRGGDPVELAI